MDKLNDGKENVKANTTSSSSNIERCDTSIYFNSDIDATSCFKLATLLREASKDAAFHAINLKVTVPLRLYITSSGGFVFDGLSVVDLIERGTTPVDTYVQGYAASMGTILSVVGRRRYILKHSYMLIHEIRNGMWGKLEYLRDEMKNTELIMRGLIDIYRRRTNMTSNMLKEVLKRDLWFTSKECKKVGLVDEII